MATELWFRNPQHYIRELLECGVENFTFDKGTLTGRGWNPFKFFDLHVPAHMNWRLLVMDDIGKVAYEYDKAHGEQAIAAHPMWTLDMPMRVLDSYLKQHKRVIYLSQGRLSIPEQYAQRQEVSNMQLDYPDSILHVKGSYSYRVLFGMNFGACDMEARESAAKGSIHLAQGSKAYYLDPNHHDKIEYSAKLLGLPTDDLDVPRNRCLFNIKSAQWAAKYYKDREFSPVLRRSQKIVDHKSKEFERLKVATSRVRLPGNMEQRQAAQDNGDFFLCNACSLQTKCDFFRFGAVCAVPGSEPTDLARFMGSHDAETIKHGLSTLMMYESNRVMEAGEREQQTGELDPHLTTMLKTLFDHGIKMVKLLDPSARGGVQINLPGSHTQTFNLSNADPKGILAGIVAEFEARGISRQDITNEMIMGIVSSDDRTKAIEGVVIASKSERV